MFVRRSLWHAMIDAGSRLKRKFFNPLAVASGVCPHGNHLQESVPTAGAGLFCAADCDWRSWQCAQVNCWAALRLVAAGHF